MVDINTFRTLALAQVTGGAITNYSAEDIDATVAGCFSEYTADIYTFLKYKYDIFQIMSQAVDAVLPKRVIDAIGAFAEVKSVGNGDKLTFKRPKGKGRARMFLTQVGQAGMYETFRLDKDVIEMSTHAVGAGVSYDLRSLCDGENLNDYVDVVKQGLEDAVYIEVQKALIAAFSATERPAANKKTATAFDATKMIELINVVKAYGTPVIFATPEFVAKMGPDAIVAGSSAFQAIYAPKDIEDIHNTGYITMFRGTPIVQIPQSFVDENKNDTTIFNPQYAYVLPAGGEKVVKVGLEGTTIIRSRDNIDATMDIEFEKLLGCCIVAHNNWGIYQNTGVTDTSAAYYANL